MVWFHFGSASSSVTARAFICSSVILRPLQYWRRTSFARTRSPVLVVVVRAYFAMAVRLSSG